MVAERIEKLRYIMESEGIDGYIIVTSDYHNSEYVGEYFKERGYMSGFTGSAGTLVVLKNMAALWTDGRYFIQAKNQLQGSGIELMPDGMDGVPDIKSYLLDNLNTGNVVGFDGRTVSGIFAINLGKELENKNISIRGDINLVDEIWNDRPELSKEPVWELKVEYTGIESDKKLCMVREKMEEYGADSFILTSLDDIAWLLNLRGNDVAYCPVFLAYMIIFKDSVCLYADKSIFSKEIKEKLFNMGIEIRGYNEIYDNLRCISSKKILLDKGKINYGIYKSISKDKELLNKENPTTELKAVKNPVEVDNFRKAHIKDGVAVTKFMCWLKQNIGKIKITELSATEKLEEFRCKQDGYIGPSFGPIMAYGEHGAIAHYSATVHTDFQVEPDNFLLSDTGGHYYEGTTDITRTYAMGNITDDMKKMYTLVLAGNLNLGAAKFPYGVRGVNLDVLARRPLWNYGLDYNHGTGHGVGYLLNVHEGPNSIRWKIPAANVNSAVFKEGMITSNEPAIYIEGKYGVRLENLFVCIKEEKKSMGQQFMKFETLTMVPFDLDAVDKRYLSNEEIELLNQYHKRVFNVLSPFFEGEELVWLEKATRAI